MPTTKVIKEALQAAGLKENERNQFTQLNADEGFCRGACMDWMRRVLHGRVAFEYERTDGAKGARREARMREIHATVMGRVVAAAQETESDLETRATTLRARAVAINDLDGPAFDAAAAGYRADEAALNQERRAYSALSDKGPMVSGWSKLSRELDALRGKPGAKRTFSNLQPATGSPPRNLGTSDKVKATIDKVIRELAAPSACMFTFKADGQVGHAVSVVRANNTSALFDPSYGMFFGPGVDATIKGVDYLLNDVYPGMQQLEFIVFLRKA